MACCLTKVLAIELVCTVDKMNFHVYFLPHKIAKLNRADGNLFHVDEPLEFVMGNFPTACGAYQFIVVCSPQNNEVVGVCWQLVARLHITAHVGFVAVDRDLNVANEVLGTAITVACRGDPWAIRAQANNWFGTKTRDHDVVGETCAITVVVELVDGIGIPDDDVADSKSIFNFVHFIS